MRETLEMESDLFDIFRKRVDCIKRCSEVVIAFCARSEFV